MICIFTIFCMYVVIFFFFVVVVVVDLVHFLVCRSQTLATVRTPTKATTYVHCVCYDGLERDEKLCL